MKLHDIDAAIRKKRAALSRLQDEILTLDRAKRLLIEESESRPKAKPRPERRTITARVAGRIRRRRQMAHPMKDALMPESDPGRARQEILDAGKPLHVDVILDKIEQRTGTRPKRSSLVGALARYSKEARHFYRSGPNVFGLLEMKK